MPAVRQASERQALGDRYPAPASSPVNEDGFHLAEDLSRRRATHSLGGRGPTNTGWPKHAEQPGRSDNVRCHCPTRSSFTRSPAFASRERTTLTIVSSAGCAHHLWPCQATPNGFRSDRGLWWARTVSNRRPLVC